ncbi:antifungal protein ginkbilobin-like protein [Dendrobium catenatum]|uniref:Antifungal protein ginkbilobin-2 n=1 Tax=Dendrobium catenatum TaxID=906689 RepID=A0A2I0WY03_9ASPA|nr:antifungal protein ginkbilobin-like protein [Dendrobium catenatum]PKU80539.1 Antifungal protein ginkbilobin-2 [Dendrobium catenatum]
MSKPPFPVVLLLLLISSTQSPAACASSFVCNLVKYTVGDEFSGNVESLLYDLAELGQYEPGKNYYENYPFRGSQVAYGRSTCSGSLTVDDCYSCLLKAVVAVKNWCYMAIGGQVEVGECDLRYEQYDFV